MTALKVTLDAPLDRFVEDQVASGAYPDAAAVVRAGLAALQSEAARVARFKALVQEGLDDISAGRVEVVEDIGAWFDQIEAELDEALAGMSPTPWRRARSRSAAPAAAATGCCWNRRWLISQRTRAVQAPAPTPICPRTCASTPSASAAPACRSPTGSDVRAMW
jgi:putative addiction module CopG family antidote